jgi:uncharacterized membrane protein YedE/YeeE
MPTFAAFSAGLVFGIGLLVSGMANPAKVIGFLDLFGSWDPSLALVMAGAIGVSLPAFAFGGRRARTFLDAPIELPASREIDARLVAGSVVFGIGWGLGGFCPGPAIVAVGALQAKALVFVAAMLAGMLAFERLERRRVPPPEV